MIEGGMGRAVVEFLADNGYTNNRVFRIGIEDDFITHGSIKELQKVAKIDEESILQKIIEVHAIHKQEPEENHNGGIVVVQEQNNLKN